MPDSSLGSFDSNLASSCVFKTIEGKQLSFQFAPKFTSESNSSRWQEDDIYGIEPLRIFWGAAGRKVNMEWEYIATDIIFTGAKIAQELRDLKAYFFKFKVLEYPIVMVKYMHVLPEEIL
jgi:hypothetical protein